MHSQDMAILQGLVSVAWADGHVATEETAVIEALLEAFHATPSEARQVRRFAQTEKTLNDVPIHELSYGDRRTLLQHAVLLSFVDGEQHEKEREVLQQLCHRLRIPAEEAAAITRAAESRAKELLQLL